MIKKIVIHATGTPAEMPVTLEMIQDMNSQERHSDPMPYHYIVNVDGKVLKGRADKEICGHLGRYSRDTLSVAFAGDSRLSSPDERCPMSELQEETMRMLLLAISHWLLAVGRLPFRYPYENTRRSMLRLYGVLQALIANKIRSSYIEEVD